MSQSYLNSGEWVTNKSFFYTIDIAHSPSTPTWNSLFLRLVPTCIASSILRVSQLWQCARTACLPHLNGGALTAFLLLCFARSAAETLTIGFLSTEFRSEQANTLCHHGCGTLGYACTLGTPEMYAPSKVCICHIIFKLPILKTTFPKGWWWRRMSGQHLWWIWCSFCQPWLQQLKTWALWWRW